MSKHCVNKFLVCVNQNQPCVNLLGYSQTPIFRLFARVFQNPSTQALRAMCFLRPALCWHNPARSPEKVYQVYSSLHSLAPQCQLAFTPQRKSRDIILASQDEYDIDRDSVASQSSRSTRSTTG